MKQLAVSVNGIREQIATEPTSALPLVLRNHLGLKGTRFGCLVAVGLVLLSGSLAGCDKAIAGSARYVPDAGSSTPPLVKLDALPTLMPTPAEAAAAMKSPPQTPIGVYDSMPPTGDAVVSDPNCFGAVFGIDESVYRGSDYQGVFGQLTGDPATPNSLRVDEGVVAFGNADEARTLVDTLTRAWKGCTGHPLTLTFGKDQASWVASGPTVSDGVAVLLRSQQGASFACAHGLAARSNVAADVTVCSGDATTVAGQASGIVNAILQKIPG
jgi:PknH-like protein